MDKVVLVDKQDRKLRVIEKQEAHRSGGRLHRAVSVLLYRRKNGKLEALLQQRRKSKLRWPGYWGNTVCTDLRPGEFYVSCGVRRLEEEMGIKVGPEELRLVFKFIYQAKYDDEWSEHEIDGVVVGSWDGKVTANKDEVEDFEWREWEKLKKETDKQPGNYGPWFVRMVQDSRLDKALKRKG